MDASFASFQARLATFEGAPATKSRRTSSRSKKAAPKSRNAWPLSAPSAQDLAYAGFVWKPTSASPDNVQCWACTCQLDGWEEADVPAFEHLTHSPNCGFAIITNIRLRHGDPGRTEDDPTSDAMVKARADTFGSAWPLDVAAGYPSVEQLATAGWFYDPADGTPDGVTCPYCHLSLDAWDAGDDPMEEHRRRATDCLFFSLSELYHPASESEPQPARTKRATKSKRASTRSSISSSTSATTKSRRVTRTSDPSVSTIGTKKSTRSKKYGSEAIENTQVSELPTDTESIIIAPTKKPTRGKKRASEAIDNTQFSELPTETESIAAAPTKKSTRGKKRASEAVDDTQISQATQPKAKRGRKKAGEAADDSQISQNEPPNPKPGKKRTSDAVEDTHISYAAQEASKRMRFSDMSSLPDDLPVGTPKKMPTELETEPFTMSSLPAGLLVGTPKRTPPHQTASEEQGNEMVWQPTDIEAVLAAQHETRGFINNILIDAGLDGLDAASSSVDALQAAVFAGLTDAEKAMNIEQWVLYNAKRGEEKLRMACEQQITAFETEGNRALAVLEAIPTY